jgi:hypothetical protein
MWSQENHLTKQGVIRKAKRVGKNFKKNKMKTILLSILCFLGIRAFSQTSVDVYVINQGGCPYGLIDTWVSPNGAGNMSLDSIDNMGFQNVHHFTINDTTYPITLTICLYVGATQAPFPPQTPSCITQVLNSPGQAITIVADCSILGAIDLGFNKGEISVFPNPTSTILNFSDLKQSDNHVIVTNAQGQILLYKESISESKSIEVSTWAPGIYNIFILSPEKAIISASKFIKE